jgi:hypothetical protein
MSSDVPNFSDVFEYCDGDLYRKTGQFLGKAGTVHHTGYVQVKVNSKCYRAHRIIFAMHHGYMPEFIDHIDGNRLNNRIENLRECDNRQNQHNAKIPCTNKTGVKNVFWDKARKKWAVFMRIKSKPTWLGRFDDLELAELVAIEARNKFQGRFARHV